MCLESTKKLLQEFSNSLESKGVKSIDCLQGRYGGTFIHPDLAVQLAQWISPSFALQVRWIRELMESVGAPSIIPNSETPSVVDEYHSGESNNIDHELQKPQLIQDTTFKLKLLNNEILDIAIRKDGYINATQLCKAGNKLFGHYQTSKQTQDYLQALSSNIGIPIMKLLDSKVGGSHSGTYVHRKVAYHLAQWISPQFALQVSNWLKDDDKSHLIPEFQEFKLMLSDGKELLIPMRKDGYVNATLLCKASGKKRLDNWMCLESTKKLLQEFSNSLESQGVKSIDCLQGRYGGTFIHPDLAVQLAQWISPSFALQVSRWIRELMLTGRVELGKEKTNAELEDIYETQRVSLDYQHYLGKDVLYFFEFIPDRNGLEDPTLLDNKELHFFEFGFTSNIQQRTSSSDYPRPNYRLDKVFVYDSGFKTSLAEKYTKNIVYDLGLKLEYFKKKECLKATYKDLDNVYELITKHQIRSQEDNEMCKYEIEKMRLEYEIMKLRQNNSIISLLEKKILTYDQMKEMFGNSIL
jgi:hypothetical protein